jgi:copper transport protein
MNRAKPVLTAFGALVAMAIAAVLLSASPAAAHADFQTSNPAPGSQVSTAPEAIVLRFTESVTVDEGAIRVYTSDRELIDVGEYGRSEGDSATVSVPIPELEEGLYAVTWRVTSADSHPVQGSFTFGVGNVSVTADDGTFAQELLAEEGGDNGVVETVYAITRFLAFASLAAVVGVSAFVVALWPEGWASSRVRRLVWVAWAVAFVTTIAGIGLQGAYASGGGLADAADPSVFADVLDTRFGKAWLFRGILLLLAVPVLLGLQRTRTRRGLLPAVGALIAAGIMVTPGLSGHASSGRWVALAVPADALHLLAMSLWFGGLAVLAIEVLRSDDVDALEPVMQRFSRVAMGTVGVIVATGAFQSVRQIAHFNDLFDTGYGRLLLVKIAAFAAVLVVASASRDIVRLEISKRGRARVGNPLPAGPGAMRAAPGLPDAADTVQRLRAAIWYEVAFAVAILAITALLVNAVPARATEPAEPFAALISSEDHSMNFDVAVTPARVGANQVHITAMQPTGTAANLVDMTVTLSAPDQDLAPMDVELLAIGGGSHYQSTGLAIPFPGRWRIEITGLVSDVEQVKAIADFEVEE